MKIKLSLLCCLSILLLCLLPISVNGQSSSDPIIITNSASYPPFSFQDENGHPQGLLIDLWNEWAKANNRNIQFLLVDWNESLELIREGKADIHAGLFQSESRRLFMDFSDQELFQLTTGLFLSNQVNGTTIEQLKDIVIGVTRGGFEEEYMRANFPNLQLKLFDNNQQLAKLAATDKIKAFVADYPVGMYFLDNYGATEKFRLLKILYSNPMYSAVPKGETKTLALLNDGWQQVSQSEKDRLLQKWIRSEQVLPSWFTSLLVSLSAFVAIFGLFLYIIMLRKSKMRLNVLVEQRTRDLQESEERLRTLINATPDTICFKDDEGRWLESNLANLDLFHLTNIDYRGRTNAELADDTHSVYKDVFLGCHKGDEQAWKQKGALRQDESILTLDGQRKTYDVIKVPIFHADGRRKGIVVVGRDITEDKLFQERLQKAEKMEAIGLMAGGVAHDLNNILSGITGYPELLLLQLPEDSALRKPIEAIKESGERASAVVADLLTVARGVASTKVHANINILISEYLESPEWYNLHSLHQHIQCRQVLAADLPNISCSPIHIKKCLMNLTINAAEAIDKPGTITISTKTHTPNMDWANKNGLEQRDYVVLTVADTGTGISEEDIHRIFEPFYTKKVMGRSGTGLGLAVVWNTMEDHRGKVMVESSGQGTCFQLYFPVASEDGRIQTENDKIEKVTGNSEHILIVDDELHLREIGSQMLQALGYKVDSVGSGELAIAFVKKHPVDLIVLDMLMDPGMNGCQTYEKILELFPHQKVIIASGFSENDNVKKTLQLGARGFIKKPYSIDQLGQVVANALSSKAANSTSVLSSD